jgi:predicted Zn-dependent peptidase
MQLNPQQRIVLIYVILGGLWILLSDFYRNIKTISGRSNAIGTYEVFFGDYKKLFTAADDFAKVTKADVQRVAKQYFTANNRTVATLVPDAAPAADKK